MKEVQANYECGVTIEKYSDIEEGDVFECFIMEEIPRRAPEQRRLQHRVF
ncbi:MAG: hypothetical protein V8S89_04920 [Oscillospiraceae bacterium]